MRFHPPNRYHAIWSAGLFDYLDDRLFVLLIKRLMRALEPGGELAIWNFSTSNPTRPYMELMGEWFLHHRTAFQLSALAQQAGVSAGAVKIGQEAEGVNLFMHISS